MKKLSLLIAALLLATPALANEPQVVNATATQSADGWRFDVAILHADTGWEHYADGWGVYTPEGKELGYRVLVHPHVNEQPFTRSLGGVEIPAGITQVIIRPHDLVHGDGPDYTLDLP